MHVMNDAAEFAECRNCRCFAVRKASRAVTQHYDRALRKTGMRATQFNTLTVLTQTGPLPMQDLAEFMGLDRTSLTRNLQPPVRKRWIKILPGDEDRRVRMVSITPAGIAALRKAVPAWKSAQAGADAVLKQAGLVVTD
jgi:DNA-binding MarR family transcriptional regulator